MRFSWSAVQGVSSRLGSKNVLGPIAALAVWCAVGLGGCAQDVGDIDRTQPNRVAKAELLDGTWYMLETVTDVPATTYASFEGETSKLEKVVWRIEEDFIFAYRSYPFLPGSEDVDGGVDYTDPSYHEAPIAAFRILKHFDVVREYNASTGEQSNVLSENDYDRPWFERDYIRVDWSRNEVTNFDLLSGWLYTPIEQTYAVDSERGEARSIYYEHDADGSLVYFDVPRRLLVEPDLYGCIISMPWYGWSYEDCAPAEIEIVSSFSKTDPRRDYEPLPYSDNEMTRFGYFRSERYVFDPRRGVLESTRQELAQRHNIWRESYERNAEGGLQHDAEGRMVPIPIDARAVRTVPYYLSQTFPDDELIIEAARDTFAQWNTQGKEALAQIRGVSPDAVTDDVFVLCSNPVAEGDHDACGEVGMVARVGDLRYSTLHWVESEQIQGPLGYGPSAADPETGEIISGRAYVYGSGLSTYASFGVDVIRFINGDLSGDELANLDQVRSDVLARAFDSAGVDKISKQLDTIPRGSKKMRDPARVAMREERRKHLNHFDRGAVRDRMERAREAGLGRVIGGEEFDRARSAALQVPRDAIDTTTLDATDPTRWLSPTHLKEMQRRRLGNMAHAVDYADMIDPNVLGLAREYAGQTDYDAIWRQLRASVFKSTALHEVGHTLGLRHNFQGTYDSLNYHKEYWPLRAENLTVPENYGDLYRLNALTENQINGKMREYQYSSIMDYGYTFNTDAQGLGRYDTAAIVYGYTAGSIRNNSIPQAECSGLNRVWTGSECRVRSMGFVEVFEKNRAELGEVGRILTSNDELGFRFDDPTTPIVPYLERWHYTTVIQAFPEMNDAFDRKWMRIDDYLAQRDADDGPVRVPYLFCSDEWVGGLLSCQVYDAGADPFEMTRTILDHYRNYYYFQNFKRDRLGWDPFYPLFSAFYYDFLPLSDYFQNWFLAPEGDDWVMDEYWWMSIHAGINLIGEALATPPYGTFCTTPDGHLFNMTNEPGQGPEDDNEYYRTVYCDESQPFFEVPKGAGRRRFSAYDVDAGYNFADMPIEAGHYWTTLAAFWALVDPEAFVLGTEADAGVFAISYYDFFGEEINQIVNAIMTEDYNRYSPVMRITDTAGTHHHGEVVYQPLAPLIDYDTGTTFDPETGRDLTELLGPSRATASLCQPCNKHDECQGYTGFGGGVFCYPILESGQAFCLRDCYDDASVCGPNETCDNYGLCVPTAGECSGNEPSCSATSPFGACPDGQSCTNGACEAIWPLVESDATFALVDDMMFYGMFYTTFAYSTRFNDQVNVFRLGTNEELAPGAGFETVSFTDPLSGIAYGALREVCDAPSGGAVGLCEACSDDLDCVGYTGDYGGTWCQPFAPNAPFACLVDCTNDPDICPVGTRCNPDKNCVPDDGLCADDIAPCSPSSPLGGCGEGTTCFEGACVVVQSANCSYDVSRLSGGAQMVLRGQDLRRRYDRTLADYWSYTGSNPTVDTALWWKHSRERWDLEYHIDKISTLRAVFDIFGMVY